MYKVNEYVGEDLTKMATARPPFGPGFQPEEVAKASKMEVWGTSFTDPGGDYCEFKLLDADGNVIGSRTVGGY